MGNFRGYVYTVICVAFLEAISATVYLACNLQPIPSQITGPAAVLGVGLMALTAIEIVCESA